MIVLNFYYLIKKSNDNNSTENACIQFSVRGEVQELSEMKSKFFSISQETGIDIAVQEENLFYRNRRLVAFDMDSTLIQIEVIGIIFKTKKEGIFFF